MLAFSQHQKTTGNSSAHCRLFELQYLFTHSIFEDHLTGTASCKTNFEIFCTSQVAVHRLDLQVRAANQQARSFMSQMKYAEGLKKLSAFSKQFVPEDGISRAILEDKLHVHFPRGARIEKRIQLYPGGPEGWFIAGGIVTDSILKELRRDTLRETDPSSYRSFRDAELACEEAVSSNPTQGGLNSSLNDRHRAPNVPPPQSAPPRSSFLSPDETPTFSPTGTRHQKIDSNDLPPRKTVSFTDLATAARYPGRMQRTVEDFADFQAWKEYCHLNGQWKISNRHQNGTASSVVPPPPPYQPVDVAGNSRQSQSGRDAGEKIKDASAPPGNISTPSRHGRHTTNDRPMKNGGDSDFDSDSDSDSDFTIIEEKNRKTLWSHTVTRTMRRNGGHRSRR